MLTLIENGEIYAPGPQGRKTILLADGKVAKVGNIERRAVESLGLEVEIIEAAGCLVTPGFIDPHESVACVTLTSHKKGQRLLEIRG